MNQIDRYILSILNIQPNLISSIESYRDNNKNLLANIVPFSNLKSCIYCNNKKILSNGYRKIKLKTPLGNLESLSITCSIKKYKCTNCNKSFSDKFNIYPNYSRISYQTIIKIMHLLKNPNINFKTVANLLSLSQQSVIRYFDKYCNISHIPFPKVICIDEVYTKNSDFHNSKYSCIFYDFFNKSIIDITPFRKKDYLLYYLESNYSKSERDNVLYVCIDMYPTYKSIIKSRFKNAIICVDSFHVIKALNDCVFNLRSRIMRNLDSSSLNYYLLKNFKFLLLSYNLDLDNKPKYNKRLNRYINYRQLLNLIFSINPDIELAYNLKNDYIFFNSSCNSISDAYTKIQYFYTSFLSSNIPGFLPFVSILGNWKFEIANSFSFFNGKRISSGISENINSKISSIIFNSRGIRNSLRRKKRIMYVVNNNSFHF